MSEKKKREEPTYEDPGSTPLGESAGLIQGFLARDNEEIAKGFAIVDDDKWTAALDADDRDGLVWTREHTNFDATETGVGGVAAKSRGGGTMPEMCVVMAFPGNARSSEEFAITIDHEIAAHCGLWEMLSPQQYDRLLATVTTQVPLETLRTDWFGEAGPDGNKRMRSVEQLVAEDPESAAKLLGDAYARYENDPEKIRKYAGIATGKVYEALNGVEPDADYNSVRHRGTGALHINPESAVGYGKLGMYVEEAIAYKATENTERLKSGRPSVAPKGSEGLGRWVKALVRDIGEVYEGRMSLRQLDRRYRKLIGRRGPERARSPEEREARGQALARIDTGRKHGHSHGHGHSHSHGHPSAKQEIEREIARIRAERRTLERRQQGAHAHAHANTHRGEGAQRAHAGQTRRAPMNAAALARGFKPPKAPATQGGAKAPGLHRHGPGGEHHSAGAEREMALDKR